MSVLDDAKTYLDLPAKMQDEDALMFARAVVTLYRLLDEKKAEIARLAESATNGPRNSVGDIVPQNETSETTTTQETEK